ncbi:MAG: energy transducer TonB [Ignavibacteriae bacterium]|nr:energy transducer TonB [Ignavibacteriota bacterium]
MKFSRERTIGWFSSVLMHAALLLLLFFIYLPDALETQEFVEVSWGATTSPSLSTVPSVTPASPVKATTTASKTTAKTQKASQPVILPERRMRDMSDEVINVLKTDKVDAPVAGTKARPDESRAVGERDVRSDQQVGERERLTPGETVGGGPGGTGPLGSSGVGADIDRGASYSIQWLDGGSRKRISGDLPRYPEGVNVQAQIKILTMVMPDGSVKAVQPEQKGNTKLEDAAMKAVRLWKFEPLRSTQPQLEQNAVVTFLFRLK